VFYTQAGTFVGNPRATPYFCLVCPNLQQFATRPRPSYLATAAKAGNFLHTQVQKEVTPVSDLVYSDGFMSHTSQAQNGSPAVTPIFPSRGPFQLARFVRWECAALFVLGVTFWGDFFVHQPDIVGYAYKMDFLGIYVGPRIVASGLGQHLYELPVQRAISAAATEPYQRSVMPFVYPGYVAVVLKPLGSLPFGAAMKVWLLMNLTAAFWSAIRLSPLFARTLWDRLAILVVFFAWTPLQLTLVQGQMGMWPTVGFVEALIALRSGRPWRAGLWISLGILKPQLVLFPLLLLAIWRCWQAIAAFLAVATAVLAVSVAAIGFWIAKYLHFLAEYNRRGAELSMYPIAMQNWRGLAAWALGTDHGLGVLALTAILTAISVAALWFISRKRPANDSSQFRFSAIEEVQYAAAIILGLLSSPHLYMHDWVAALPAGFILWHGARERFEKSPREISARILLWLIGLAPLVFFSKQFIAGGPMVAIFGLGLVSVAIVMIGKHHQALAAEP
jgi:hypothetical protein